MTDNTKPVHIPDWRERCERHPAHSGIVSHTMIQARMQEEIEALRAENERLKSAIDCRTCRHHTTATGGCISVLRCIEGSAYQRAGVRQCWTETL